MTLSNAQMPSSPSKTKEDEYETHLRSENLARYFPRFVEQVKLQRGDKMYDQSANWGRSCVFEFPEKGEQEAKVTEFSNPNRLRDHLYIQGGPSRRLWLLEDLSLNWMTVLGAHLRIPPSFFAFHWADSSGAEFNDRHPFFSDPERQFLLKYPRFRKGRVNLVNGDSRDAYLAMKCNAERCFFPSTGEDPTFEDPDVCRTYHKLSFRSNQLGPGTWDGKCSFPVSKLV